jgi:hypothetical protein
MTDDEIVDAVKDKHNIPLATGVYREAHLHLVSMAREAERTKIADWFLKNNQRQLADSIKRADYLKEQSK